MTSTVRMGTSGGGGGAPFLDLFSRDRGGSVPCLKIFQEALEGGPGRECPMSQDFSRSFGRGTGEGVSHVSRFFKKLWRGGPGKECPMSQDFSRSFGRGTGEGVSHVSRFFKKLWRGGPGKECPMSQDFSRSFGGGPGKEGPMSQDFWRSFGGGTGEGVSHVSSFFKKLWRGLHHMSCMNLWISDPSLSKLKKFQRHSAVLYKNCIIVHFEINVLVLYLIKNGISLLLTS